MGRLPSMKALLLPLSLAFLGSLGCDSVSEKDAPMATNERSQAIVQKGPVTLSSPVTIAVATTKPVAPKKPRSLCGGKLDEAGRSAPKSHVSRAAAKGTPELPESLAIGGGKWTFINLWAGWCAPCKEEIPRLLAFEKKLVSAGAPFRLSFVSNDDDERQLNDFLEHQPPTGLRASYWLTDGKERQEWLSAAGIADAGLPYQLLVDPKGKIRCAFQDTIEDGDYAEILAIVSRH